MQDVRFFIEVQGQMIELPFNAIEKENGKVHFISGMKYDQPIKTEIGLIRNNGLKTRFYFEPCEIEPKSEVQPKSEVLTTWEQIDALRLPKLRHHLAVGPTPGLTTEKAKVLLANKLGIEIPNDTAKVDVQPKTEKVEPSPFNAQDAPQVDGNNALVLLSNALSQGKMSIETYLQQISLLQQNGII